MSETAFEHVGSADRGRSQLAPGAAGADPARATRWFTGRLGTTVAFVAVFSAGLLLRLSAYFKDRSMWLDECWLASNIVSRSFTGLFRPLDDYQGAPLGFLALEKLGTTLLGNNEFALRLFPLVSSVVALLLFARIGSRFGARTGLIALALAAFAPGLVYYSSEAKQYGVDATAALLILDGGLAAWERGMTPRRALGFGLLGMVVLWFSHPSVFVLAGAGSALFVACARQGRRREARLVAAVVLAWLLSFCGEYVAHLRVLSRNEVLMGYSIRGYLPFPPRTLRDISKYFLLGFGAFGVPFEDYSESSIGEQFSLLGFVLWLAGLVVLASERRRVALAMLVAPLGIATVLAMAARYPLFGRTILYLSGPTLLVIAAGLGVLIGSGSRRERWVGLALLFGTLLILIEHDAREALKQPPSAGARTVFAKVARDWRDGDLLVLHWTTTPVFEFYRKTVLIPGLEKVTLAPFDISEQNSATLAHAGGPLKGLGRIWVVADRHRTDFSLVPKEVMFHDLDAAARRVNAIESGNCSGVLYDCR